MARQPKPTAPPLATTIRQALASGWHSLAALDTLTAARGSDARRLVHEALRALRGEGCVLEERVGRPGVEVRLAPAPVPADGQPSPEDIEEGNDPRACPECEEIHPVDDRHDGPFTPNLRRPSPPIEGEPLDAASYYDARTRDTEDAAFETWAARKIEQAGGIDALEGAHLVGESEEALAREAGALDAPASPVDQAEPVEAASRPVTALSAHLAAMGHVEEAREVEGLPTPPGPSSRCAVCDRPYARHADAAGVPYAGPEGHPFTPKPRGRPPATPSPPMPPIPNAAPAILPRVRQRRAPGPVVDVDGGRVERFRSHATPETRAMLDAVCDEADARLAAVTEPETSRVVSERRAPTKPRRIRARIEGGAVVADKGPPPCRPPLCYRDDIHEPSVQGFARPLCERHRAWVEQAGGTVTPCPACKGIEPKPLQQRCVGITHCAACMRPLETLPMGTPLAPKAETV